MKANAISVAKTKLSVVPIIRENCNTQAMAKMMSPDKNFNICISYHFSITTVCMLFASYAKSIVASSKRLSEEMPTS